MQEKLKEILDAFETRMRMVYEKHEEKKEDSWMDDKIWPEQELRAAFNGSADQLEALFELLQSDVPLDEFTLQSVREQLARESIDVALWCMFIWHRLAGEDDGY